MKLELTNEEANKIFAELPLCLKQSILREGITSRLGNKMEVVITDNPDQSDSEEDQKIRRIKKFNDLFPHQKSRIIYVCYGWNSEDRDWFVNLVSHVDSFVSPIIRIEKEILARKCNPDVFWKAIA